MTYRRKKVGEWILTILGLVIFALIMWETNRIVDQIRTSEKKKMTIWADAVRRKSELANSTNNFFYSIAEDQQRRANLIGQAFLKITNAGLDEDIVFYLNLITENKTIPCVLTDQQGNVTFTNNLDSNELTEINNPELRPIVFKRDNYQVIPVNYYGRDFVYVHYKESKIYTQLRFVLDDLIKSFFSEIMDNSPSLPVILTDSTFSKVFLWSNIDTSQYSTDKKRLALIEKMRLSNEPIRLALGNGRYGYVVYEDSTLLKYMRFYPVFQLLIVLLFGVFTYLLISGRRRSEQDQIWVGMSKETAHQLGTPISSLMAWNELLKEENINPDIITEINKDINHLETIAQRFSKIGSVPTLENENLVQVVSDFVNYFKNRTSSKIFFTLNTSVQNINIKINRHLFEWVLENLFKNAVDAMDGNGTIFVDIYEDNRFAYIEVSDTGKGIEPKLQKEIFKPGFTTKNRGWGLGLTLAKRIINQYHGGKIELKDSSIKKGSVFVVRLKKKL